MLLRLAAQSETGKADAGIATGRAARRSPSTRTPRSGRSPPCAGSLATRSCARRSAATIARRRSLRVNQLAGELPTRGVDRPRRPRRPGDRDRGRGGRPGQPAPDRPRRRARSACCRSRSRGPRTTCGEVRAAHRPRGGGARAAPSRSRPSVRGFDDGPAARLGGVRVRRHRLPRPPPGDPAAGGPARRAGGLRRGDRPQRLDLGQPPADRRDPARLPAAGAGHLGLRVARPPAARSASC